MLKKLLPVLLALVGLGLGVAVGKVFQPVPEPASMAEAAAVSAETGQAKVQEATATPEASGETAGAAHGEPAEAGHEPDAGEEGAPTHDYVKLNNQFVIPVVEDGQVASMVIMSLSLEVSPGGSELVYAMEPKLRDELLQVLFDHANSGGFRGAFTETTNMVVLRDALRESAIKTLGAQVTDVLITDIARQDL